MVLESSHPSCVSIKPGMWVAIVQLRAELASKFLTIDPTFTPLPRHRCCCRRRFGGLSLPSATSTPSSNTHSSTSASTPQLCRCSFLFFAAKPDALAFNLRQGSVNNFSDVRAIAFLEDLPEFEVCGWGSSLTRGVGEEFRVFFSFDELVFSDMISWCFDIMPKLFPPRKTF